MLVQVSECAKSGVRRFIGEFKRVFRLIEKHKRQKASRFSRSHLRHAGHGKTYNETASLRL